MRKWAKQDTKAHPSIIHDYGSGEGLKEKAKQRAHYRCCLCHINWVSDIYQLQPREDSSADDGDPGVPLCSDCYELFGEDPQKREFIRASREFWYDYCEKQSRSNIELTREMYDKFGKCIATKEDVLNAIEHLDSRINDIISRPLSMSEQRQQISDITSAFSCVIEEHAHTVLCPNCDLSFELPCSECPNCGFAVSEMDIWRSQ
jgi:hypothetical protein